MGFDDRVVSDEQLIQRCLDGDISAYRYLYKQHEVRLYNIAMRINRNVQDAEDALQETFVKIFKALPNFNGDCKFSTWIYRILLNTCFTGLKKKKSIFETFESSPADQLNEPEENNQDPVANLILEQELAALPDGYRAAFILHEIEGFSHEEIAEILNITVGTSKSQLFKARKMLKKRLKPYRDQIEVRR